MTRLNIISRAGWGAADPDHDREGERGFYDPIANIEGWMVYDEPLKNVLDTIVVHHSALPASTGVKEIQQLHMDRRGFADIGYHFIIDAGGQIYEGRNITVRGAHTGGQNFGKIGIVLLGNFETVQPTVAQIASLKALSSCLANNYKVTYFAGHRDFQPGETVCPGRYLWQLLPELAESIELDYQPSER